VEFLKPLYFELGEAVDLSEKAMDGHLTSADMMAGNSMVRVCQIANLVSLFVCPRCRLRLVSSPILGGPFYSRTVPVVGKLW
jgi:hypothetical protein